MSTPRNHPERPREEFDAIETAAADWLARREFGLTPEESAELERWLRQDERHARVFGELQMTAAIFDRHPEALARTSGEAAGSPTGRASAPARRSRALRPAAWAALAAALVIGVFLTWRLATRDAREYNLTAQTEIGGLRTLALPDGSVAVEARGKYIKQTLADITDGDFVEREWFSDQREAPGEIEL